MGDENPRGISTEISPIDREGYIHQVKREDTGSRIRISKGDYLILRVYREKKRKPIPTIIHCMIGQAAKCWLEDHDSKIRVNSGRKCNSYGDKNATLFKL